jgi:hypothetical protein
MKSRAKFSRRYGANAELVNQASRLLGQSRGVSKRELLVGWRALENRKIAGLAPFFFHRWIQAVIEQRILFPHDSRQVTVLLDTKASA